MWYIPTMGYLEYYSAIKRNEFERVVVRKRKKNKYHVNTYIWNLEIDIDEPIFKEWRYRYREQTCAPSGGRKGWDAWKK